MRKTIFWVVLLVFSFAYCRNRRGLENQIAKRIKNDEKLVEAFNGSGEIAKIGNVVYDFKLYNQEGNLKKLSDFKNKVILLLFWVPKYEGCNKGDCTNTDCIEELKRVKKFVKNLGNKSLSILAITRGRDKKEREFAKKVFAENNFDFQLLFDPELKMTKYFWAVPQPALFLIDKELILRTPISKSIEFKFKTKKFKDLIIDLLNDEIVPEKEFLHPIIDEKLPSIVLLDIRNNEYKIDEYIGKKKLIIVLWNYSCSHCLKELPLLQSYYLKNKDKKDFEMFGIVKAENVDARKLIEERLKENHITFPNLIDETGKVWKIFLNYKINTVPTMLFVDKDGYVKNMLRGYNENTENLIDKIIDEY